MRKKRNGGSSENPARGAGSACGAEKRRSGGLFFGLGQGRGLFVLLHLGAFRRDGGRHARGDDEAHADQGHDALRFTEKEVADEGRERNGGEPEAGREEHVPVCVGTRRADLSERCKKPHSQNAAQSLRVKRMKAAREHSADCSKDDAQNRKINDSPKPFHNINNESWQNFSTSSLFYWNPTKLTIKSYRVRIFIRTQR